MSTRLDELLSRLGDPSVSAQTEGRDPSAWDDFAAETLERAVARDAARAPTDLDALLSAPSLAPEPGEPAIETGGASDPMSQRRDSRRLAAVPAPPSSMHEPVSLRSVSKSSVSGDGSQMSDDHDSQPRPSRARPSLKDLAVRVSKTPPAPVSSRSGSSPDSAPLSSAPISNAPIVPPSAVPSSAGPVSKAPISSAPISTSVSASASPRISEVPAPVSASATKTEEVKSTSKAPATLASGKPQEKEGGSLVWLYGLVGVGVAAAAGYFFFIKPGQDQVSQPTPATTVVAPDEKKQEADLATPEVKKPTGDEAPKDDAVDLNALDNATAKPVIGGGPRPVPTGEQLAAAPSGTPWTPPEAKQVEKVNPDGTFDEALAKKAGPMDEKNEATPAAEDNTPKNLPDKPPQGSLTAAASAARGAAKSCVAGADENTQVNIVFGSGGTVQSVSVSGWAAGKAAEGCIKSAVKGVTVSPFSKPSYPLPVVLRP